MAAHHPPLATADPETGTGLYCYGVMWARAAAEQSEGVAGARVEAIRSGDLAALVSPVAATKMRARRADLLKHLDVLTAALSGGVVLPFRFGTIFADEEDLVGTLLEARRDELSGLLREFDGLVELNVKAFFREAAVLGEIVRESPRIARLREQTTHGPEAATYGQRIELGELVAAELASRSAAEADQILRRLRPLARNVDVDTEPVEHQVLRAAFLVEQSRLETFDAEMDALAREREGRIDFKYLGPLPPHSFVALEAR
jgi:hypothetical protein